LTGNPADSYNSYNSYKIGCMFIKRKPSQAAKDPPDDRAIITTREADILEILVPGEKYGLQIADRVGDRQGKEMPIGSLYTTMDRMERKGLVTSQLRDPNPACGGNRRRFYRITGLGCRSLDEHRQASERVRHREGGLANA
jgi:PadR family transcriptional regulator PadR